MSSLISCSVITFVIAFQSPTFRCRKGEREALQVCCCYLANWPIASTRLPNTNLLDVIGQLGGIYRMWLVEDNQFTGCDWLTQQRTLACPQRKDDTQIREAFQIFFLSNVLLLLLQRGSCSTLGVIWVGPRLIFKEANPLFTLAASSRLTGWNKSKIHLYCYLHNPQGKTIYPNWAALNS